LDQIPKIKKSQISDENASEIWLSKIFRTVLFAASYTLAGNPN